MFKSSHSMKKTKNYKNKNFIYFYWWYITSTHVAFKASRTENITVMNFTGILHLKHTCLLYRLHNKKFTIHIDQA